MEKKRILYVSQEIHPYLPESDISKTALALPKKMNELGHEVRVFMPRFGLINERRHQLHEVIRLSGINIIVNDMDQPLIIKVASVPQARMQVYFIDNEEYFRRKATFLDEDHELFEDNDERILFFGKGVIETVKKLGWKPDIIHIHGWMTCCLPLYIKEFEQNEPLFKDTKIVFSSYNNSFEGEFGSNIYEGLEFDGIEDEEVLDLYNEPTALNLNKAAIKYSDYRVKGSEEIDEEIIEFAKALDIPVFDGSNLAEKPKDAVEFYNEVTEEAPVA